MKPMLAVEAGQFAYPIYASVKIDGIRAIIKDDMVLSRSLKRIPNKYVQDTLGCATLTGLDGELTVGPAFNKNVMQATTSGVMSRDGQPDFTYWVFDFWTDHLMPFGQRLQIMQRANRDNAFSKFDRVMLLPQVLIHNQAELDAYEASVLEQGYEGVILRSPAGLYKYGRSTTKEAYLLKLKRFVDAEAVVIDLAEKMTNNNEATIDETGHTKRSSHQENLVPADTLGAFLVRNTEGVEFRVSPGVLTHEARKAVWDARKTSNTCIGKVITYKTFTASGVKDKPRFNVFKCFRSRFDM